MNSALIFSVLVALATAGPARERRQANCVDSFKNVPNPCTNNPSSQVYFPHPSDSSKFIQCDRYGRMYIIQCPENLQYSVLTSTCRGTNPEPGTIVTNAPVTPGQTGIVGGNPCTAAALSAGHYYFAVAGNPRQFIECDMLGNPAVLPCPGGLVWDQGRLSCVYNFNVGGTGVTVGTGGSGGTGSVTVAPGSGTSGTLSNPCTAATIAANKLFFPHPDPSKFIQCDLWGDLFVNNCPAGLIWNQYSETCASAFVIVNGGK
ncbi:uncharacterized protein LOC127881248 isoform X2 [Dreissena polymorpha]|uniref:Chitin-binding type-2 domain-containing protein n=1 Tax=Dreissena polymorpha TaxID=45954 RepID=A0A9D4MTU6_DREPO|nr:uncharacterized protein LOC127881248 isoform X1 [Dreissena polymorpha]XP_052284967.1 uncharacterized protein LOC127881248 isoform X2 [Dreissena polymorpha]KAH3881696.1 hypothetical protein DPMN_005623 [Dreissena polymorpha]